MVSDLFLHPQKSGRCPIKRRFFNSLDTKGKIFFELGWWYLVNPPRFLLMQRMGAWTSFDSDLSSLLLNNHSKLSANPFPMARQWLVTQGLLDLLVCPLAQAGYRCVCVCVFFSGKHSLNLAPQKKPGPCFFSAVRRWRDPPRGDFFAGGVVRRCVAPDFLSTPCHGSPCQPLKVVEVTWVCTQFFFWTQFTWIEAGYVSSMAISWKVIKATKSRNPTPSTSVIPNLWDLPLPGHWNSNSTHAKAR